MLSTRIIQQVSSLVSFASSKAAPRGRALLWIAPVTAVMLLGVGLAQAQHEHGAAAAKEAPAATQPATQPATQSTSAKRPYPLTTCIVSGSKLGKMGKAVVYQHEGREIQFCCKGCIADFKADPAKYLAKMDKMIIAAQSENYPRKTCVVTGEALGTKPIKIVADNRLIVLCCADCVDEVKKDPAKFAAKVDEPDPAPAK